MAKPTKAKGAPGFLLLTLVMLCATAICFTAYDINSGELLYASSVLTVLYAGIICFFWWKATDSAFDPFTLFLLSMLLFMAGHQILHIMGLTDSIGGILYSIVSPETTNMALLQILICFFCFGIGAALKLYQTPKASAFSESATQDVDIKIMRKVGWAMVILSAGPAVYYLSHNVGRVMSGGYGAFMYQGGSWNPAVSAARALAMFFLPGCLFILSSSKKASKQAYIAAFLIACYSLPSFFLGERSRAIMPLLACVWVWNRLIWPIPKLVLAPAGLFMLFVVFPIIRVTRMNAGASRTDLSAYIDAFSGVDNPFVMIVAEMGQSGLRIVAWVYDLIPERFDFSYGLTYLKAFGVLLPNLFGESSYSSDLSAWLVSIMEPQWAVEGGGYGFCFLAEAYMNFGWPGVIIISGLVGYMMAALALRTIRSDSRLQIAFVGSLCLIILFFPRAETRQLLRQVVWYCLFPYSLVLFLRRQVRTGISSPKNKKPLIKVAHDVRPKT